MLDLSAEGLNNRQIADRLGVSVHTVNTHWRRLRDEFKAKTKAEVVMKAHRAISQQLKQEVDELKAQLARHGAETSTKPTQANFLVGVDKFYADKWAYRLAQAFEVTPVVAHRGIIGGDWYKFEVTANCSLYGLKQDEFPGVPTNVVRYFCLADLEPVHALFHTILEKKPKFFIYEYRILHPDGHEIWLREYQTLLWETFTGDQVEYFSIAVPIHDLKCAAKQHKPMEPKLIFDLNKDFVPWAE